MNEAKDLIQIVKDALGELETWNVYHEDVFNEELSKIEELIAIMEAKI